MEFARLEALPALGVGLLLNPHTFGRARAPPAYEYLEIIPDRFWLDRGPRSGTRIAELGADGRARSTRWPPKSRSSRTASGSRSGARACSTRGYLDQIALWQQRYGFAWHSDHLAFSRLSEHGVEIHAAVTLPLTRDDESLAIAGRPDRAWSSSASPCPSCSRTTSTSSRRRTRPTASPRSSTRSARGRDAGCCSTCTTCT